MPHAQIIETRLQYMQVCFQTTPLHTHMTSNQSCTILMEGKSFRQGNSAIFFLFCLMDAKKSKIVQSNTLMKGTGFFGEINNS